MLHADCAFRMGHTHLVCQDYAVAQTGDAVMAIVADGCSSSPDTDIGARLLVKSAQSLLHYLPDPCCSAFSSDMEQYHQDAVKKARAHAVSLGLPLEAIDATLLTLYVRSDRWFASLYGDGVIVAHTRDRQWEMTVVSQTGGYPYYPNYAVDPERRHALLQQPDNARSVESTRFDPEGNVLDTRTETCPIDDACVVVQGSVEEHDWAAVLSDGIHSFYHAVAPTTGRSGEGVRPSRPAIAVPAYETLRELLAFKSLTGYFVQRRMQRFQQQCAARGLQHYDDIAVGAIAFGGG